MAQLNHTGEQLDAAIAAVLASYKDVSAVDAQPADVVAGKKYVKADGTVTEGTLVVPTPPSGNQDITTTDQYDVSAKATARISYADRLALVPGNIKAGVTVLGVTGTLSPGFDYLDVGSIGFGEVSVEPGSFDAVNEMTKLRGNLNGTPFEAALMFLGEYSRIFGMTDDGLTFVEFVLDDSDKLTTSYHSLH